MNSPQPPDDENSLTPGQGQDGARFPVAPPRAALPDDYADALGAIKQRIEGERLRVVVSANAAMVCLYWEIGRVILDWHERSGWGARVIDRLSADLREAFPDMRGFSPRNLKYMRAFASAWPDRAFVQKVSAQLPWYHQIALLEKLDGLEPRLLYAEQAMQHGRSQNVLTLQIRNRLRCVDRGRLVPYNIGARTSGERHAFRLRGTGAEHHDGRPDRAARRRGCGSEPRRY